MFETAEPLARLSDRISRAEELVVLQRARVLQYQAKGLDAGKALALLKLMEGLVEQFHASWRVLRGCAARSTSKARKDRSAPEAWASEACKTVLEPRSQPAHRSELAPLHCPHCRLPIWVRRDGAPTFVYDVADWQQLCRHSELRSPLLCHLLLGKDCASLH